ncbi:recombinase family protein [Flavonifractor plautii]|nr:recombinase family protein [Flavonifractor plautii]
MKRVYCLYRVSTLGQVEKDDIPMQRQACHAFAEKQGWQIIAEFSEKGVSGFKQSAEQREALVAIKQAAILKKFDVLLVFMFDRLGRRDDETPFVVEWFVKNGIAVWSVMEGEQRFENHVDKLLNYIRFWQSSGESIKTALRTRVRMEQLIQENGYVGGTAPYGYRLCKLGRVNKRGFEVHDLLMDPAKAEVIKTIFRLYCKEDMGPYRIAVHLTQQGELTRRGTQWNAASVRNILGNAIYTGIRTYGAIQTERFSHLQIVSDELYLCAQQSSKRAAWRSHAPPIPALGCGTLKDRPYCMHCGKPVTVSRNRKSCRKRDGTVAVYDRMKYICINKNAFEPCTGQRNYSARRIDQLILEAVGRMLFSDAFKIPSMDENSALSRCRQLAQELV